MLKRRAPAEPQEGRLEMLEQRDAQVRTQAARAIVRAEQVLTPDAANAAQAAIRGKRAK
jgi:hypothetical protein